MTYNNKLIKGAVDRFNRKILPGISLARDYDDLVNQYDLSKLIGQSRAIYHNNPLVKNAIDSKASYTIGNAFEYKSLSKDPNVKFALDNAIKQWSKIAEVSGKTFNDVQYLISTLIDVDGDTFVLLSERKDGYPVIQMLEAHAIGSRENRRIDRKTLWEEKGVLYDKKTKKPVLYRILGETEKDDTLVSAQNIIRCSEPSLSQRGTPLTASCLRLIQDIEHSQELLLTQHLLATVLSVVEHNETGTSDYNLSDGVDTGSGLVKVESINDEGGEIRHYKANSGSKMEFLTNNNPSLPWQEYQDNLTNLICLSLGWPKTFVGQNTGTGVNDRLAIRQAEKTCLDRQTLLIPYFTRICNWVIAKLIKNGYLDIELSEDWYECTFSKPKFISVDLARDSKAIQSEYTLGLKNLTQILAEEGRDLEDHLTERYTEEAIRIKIKSKVETEHNVQLDDLTARLVSANQFQESRPLEQSQ